MKVLKILVAVAMVSSFAACKPASCKKLHDCCTAISGSNPAVGASCTSMNQLNNGDQCTQALNALKQMATMTGTVPAACN